MSQGSGSDLELQCAIYQTPLTETTLRLPNDMQKEVEHYLYRLDTYRKHIQPKPHDNNPLRMTGTYPTMP